MEKELQKLSGKIEDILALPGENISKTLKRKFANTKKYPELKTKIRDFKAATLLLELLGEEADSATVSLLLTQTEDLQAKIILSDKLRELSKTI